MNAKKIIFLDGDKSSLINMEENENIEINGKRIYIDSNQENIWVNGHVNLKPHKLSDVWFNSNFLDYKPMLRETTDVVLEFLERFKDKILFKKEVDKEKKFVFVLDSEFIVISIIQKKEWENWTGMYFDEEYYIVKKYPLDSILDKIL